MRNSPQSLSQNTGCPWIITPMNRPKINAAGKPRTIAEINRPRNAPALTIFTA